MKSKDSKNDRVIKTFTLLHFDLYHLYIRELYLRIQLACKLNKRTYLFTLFPVSVEEYPRMCITVDLSF
jgi:hypothetical protein